MPQSPCSFCSVNKGCLIYEQRPAECRNFKCSWLIGKGGDQSQRPDKTGVVPVHEIIAEIGEIFLILTEFIPGALESEFVFRWVRNNLLHGNYTIVRPIAGKHLLYIPRDAQMPTQEEHHFLENYWQTEVVAIPFESWRIGLLL